jgi:hypothetical protein
MELTSTPKAFKYFTTHCIEKLVLYLWQSFEGVFVDVPIHILAFFVFYLGIEIN